MTATFTFWSAIGDCPLTNRTGSYCDELLTFTRDVASHQEAKTIMTETAHNLSHCTTGHVAIPGLDNQNYRSQWFNG